MLFCYSGSMKDVIVNKPKIYQEEFDYIFSKKAFCVRGATVISAFIEWQIFSLAGRFLEEKGVIHEPGPSQEYNQSLYVLRVNKVLLPEELEEIKKFRTERNKSIHNIFKGMTRDEWNKQNTQVVKLGKPIVIKLDKKLYSV